MPQMKFLTDEPDSQWTGNLFGIMLYPDDENKREELLTVLKAKNYLPELQNYPIPPDVILTKSKPCGCLQWEEWSRTLLDIAVTLIDAPPYDKIINKTAQKGGAIAGEKLYIIAQIECSGLKGSAAKAEHMMKCSDRTNRDSWKKFMSVAHLHTAMWIYPCLYGGDHFPLDRPLDFLKVAEYFRRFGENFYPGNQHKPVLDPRKTWKPPKNFPIEDISIIVPKLNKSARAEVADYLTNLNWLKKSRSL
jgi:hypothetical protein